ncbi:fimbria/pilus outer membrane usher protein [Serratia microhaemolytica]|uniref:fimbria/pilus outer membrane usher protein n=1 Tax=Serratia microhaemolytica TaxID=2675110 RepID=UPI000FDEA6CE|nr:fimbria/pilus outer membrane usher protein [Serratia microhaemolytica]
MKLTKTFYQQKPAREWCLHPLTLALCLLGLQATNVWGRDYFDPAFLSSGDGSIPVDLSEFEIAGNIPEGLYLVDIYLNKELVSSREVNFIKDEAGKVLPELTPQELQEMGVAVAKIEALSVLPPNQPAGDLTALIPYSQVDFDLSQLRLNINVPQVNMDRRVGGYVDPKLWDNGIPAMLFNYNLNASQSKVDGQAGGSGMTTQNFFASMNGGINLGPWRLRSSLSHTMSKTSVSGNDRTNRQTRWGNVYLQRDIQVLNSSLTLGEISTGGSIFDGVSFRGAKLVSSSDMLPSSQRGFAPVISGIAKTNALITVTQNGRVIYQTNVSPGPFTITDITQASSGDLIATVAEEDGSKQIITQGYSTLPVMLRPGGMEYELSLGRVDSGGNTEGSRSPTFILGTVTYGLPSYVTLYGGVIAASDYQSLALGTGLSLGNWGAFSTDVTGSRTKLPGHDGSVQGAAFRARYSKSMLTSGTSLDLTAYRYATRNFYSLSEATTAGYRWREDWAPWLGERKRSSWQTNISQSLGKWGSIYLRGSRDDYWGTKRVVNSISAGFSSSVKRIGYSINYSENHSKDYKGDFPVNRQVSVSVSVPFSLFSNAEMARSVSANYSLSNDNSGRTTHQLGVGGSLLNNKLSWNLSQSRDNQGSGTSGNLGLSYSADLASMSLGYGYTRTSRTINASASGGVLVHRNGVVLTQYIGDSIALVSAPGFSGGKLSNSSARTNRWGYAVAPYLQNYQRNVISLDPSTLPDGVDLITNSVTVYPTKGAVVEAKFKTRVGRQAMLVLSYAGKPVPFGAMASLLDSEDGQNSSIVGDGGMVYLSGLPDAGQLHVQWGRAENQQCHVAFDFGKRRAADSDAMTIVQQDLQCD